MRAGLRIASALGGCGLLAGGAAADMLSDLLPTGIPGYGTAPGVTVRSRIRPETEPPGLHEGAFVFRPVLDETTGYDSAPFGSGPGSWTFGTRPSLLISSDWSRHALGAYVAVNNISLLGLPSQSRTDATASIGGALDIGRNRLTVAASSLLQHQDETQIGALVTDKPVAVQLNDVRAAYTFNEGRWTATPAIRISTWHYGNATQQGVPLPQAYRDHTLVEGSMTLGYEVAPRRQILFVTRALGQQYPHSEAGQPARNSTGYEALFGYSDDDGMWRYSFLAGLETRQFASTAYKSHTAPIIEAELAWTPTGLTTITARLTRSIEDAAQEGVGEFTYTAARLRLDHEYRRDILLSASAAVQNANYQQGGGTQSGYAFGAGITWLASRFVHVSLTYDFSELHGGQAPSYTRNLALVTLRLGL